MWNPFLHRHRCYPVKLIVDIHTACNGRCTMCPYPKLSRRQSQGKMDWRLYCAIVQEFAVIGRRHAFQPELGYCYMGEAFLADDLDRYVDYALKRDVAVYLNTNAAAMTPTKVDALLTRGFAGKIHVSFHGITPEVYQRITGLDYEVALKHTLYLLEHYDARQICIRGVDDNWPAGEKERWFQFWRPRGVQLEYLPPISRCGLVGRLVSKTKQQKESLRIYGCQHHHPLVEMVILFDGRAVMCCQDMARELIWGNVDEDGILGVWNGAVRREAVKQLYSGCVSPASFVCSRCEQALTMAGFAGALGRAVWRKMHHRGRSRQAAVL